MSIYRIIIIFSHIQRPCGHTRNHDEKMFSTFQSKIQIPNKNKRSQWLERDHVLVSKFRGFDLGKNGSKYVQSIIIQLYLQTMSLMTAGKQISVGSNQAFGRGLFIVDPDVAEREANKKNAYKQQLRMQMQEQARRKEEQKRRLREQDDRLEKKFYAELAKETQKKNQKQPVRNDKNAPPPQKPQMIKSELYKEPPEPPKQQNYDFRSSLRANTQQDYSRNPYLHRQPNLYQMQQQQFFNETSAQKLRAMKEMLEEKMNEVYRKINQSKDLQVEKELELIRKKINTTNVNYQNENPKLKEFQSQFSQFYKIPKKMTYDQNPIKNLNYESHTELKRNNYPPSKNNESSYAPQERMHMSMSRNRQSRESSASNNEGWGRKKGKNNFLGNREAADFQIESISNNIDNILNEYDK